MVAHMQHKVISDFFWGVFLFERRILCSWMSTFYKIWENNKILAPNLIDKIIRF